jgi:hypothetical protein
MLYVWYLVPLSLNLCLFSKMSMNSLGFFIAIAKLSTYMAIYSYILPCFLIQMSGSALHGKNLSSIVKSANLSCHLAQLLCRPYRALLIINMWPSLSPNSGSAMSYDIYVLGRVGFKVGLSVAHGCSSLSSARNKMSLNPCKLTTPK